MDEFPQGSLSLPLNGPLPREDQRNPDQPASQHSYLTCLEEAEAEMANASSWRCENFPVVCCKSFWDPTPVTINLMETLGHNTRVSSSQKESVRQKHWLHPDLNSSDSKFIESRIAPLFSRVALQEKFALRSRSWVSKDKTAYRFGCIRGTYHRNRGDRNASNKKPAASTKRVHTTRKARGGGDATD